ncbi:tetratricopeptide repeat protein [Breznakiellaceae bacterium SP9]
MGRQRFESHYNAAQQGKKIFHTICSVFSVLVIAGLIALFFLNQQGSVGEDLSSLQTLWEDGKYREAFELAGERLAGNPLNYSLLTLRGYSAFQLALAQINRADTLTYIDACIWSLRKAMLSPRRAPGNTADATVKSVDGGLFYVLGKAYYQKGQGYMDLAIKYLEAALSESYTAADIPEYLGLAYAAVQDYRHSVEAFTLALTTQEDQNTEPADLLLLSIARSYRGLGDNETAAAYLIRCTETTKDSFVLVRTRLLLGEIFSKTGNTKAAEAQFLAIINDGNENAEAHYQLGELYNTAGDAIRARAEWRAAYHIDPAFEPVRQRLNLL